MDQRATRALDVADIIELRLDCLDEQELSKATDRITQVTARLSIPVIVTLRPAEQGGHSDLTIEQRAKFWQQLSRSKNVLLDVELEMCASTPDDGSNLICSHHDFAGVPGDIDRLYEQLAATRAHSEDSCKCD